MRTPPLLLVSSVLMCSVSVVAPAQVQVPPHATMLNPTTWMNQPILVHDGDHVHAFGFSTTTIRHARSHDGGRTWPLLEVALGAYAPYPNQSAPTMAAVVAGPGTLIVVANGQFLGPVYWRSTNHGSTWSATTSLFALPGPYSSSELALFADGPDVVAIWLRRNGEVRSRRSVDGGATWLPSQVLDVTIQNLDADRLVGQRNGSTIDLFWNRSSSGTVHQRSTDGGASWLAAPDPVHPLDLTANVGIGVVASDGTNLSVFVGLATLLRSTNGGASWSSSTIPGMTSHLCLAQEGALVVAVGKLGSNTFVVSASTDYGATWSASPLVLPSPVILYAEVKIFDGVAYVRFFPSAYLGLVTTRDGGVSWQLVGGPVDAGFWPAAGRNVHVGMQALPAFPWWGFYAYVGLGSSVLGAATPGSGGFAPRLVADGLPFQGGTTTLRVHDALGGSVGALAVSLAPPAPLPLGSAIVWPTAAPILFAFATGGSAGQPGTGGFALPVSVPVSPALVGASFTSQALVFDAANPDGFAVSNALETWLR